MFYYKTTLQFKLYQPAAAAAAAKSLQSCPTLCDPMDGSPPGSCPWDSPGKNTGVGCHFLLQCMKVESESEVADLCPTLRDPMDCSLPGSSIHGIFQARVLESGAIVQQVFFLLLLLFLVSEQVTALLKHFRWRGLEWVQQDIHLVRSFRNRHWPEFLLCPVESGTLTLLSKLDF